MKKLYENIDRLWGGISKIVFVRFQFDIPIENLKELSETGKLVFVLTTGGFIEWLILSSWCRTQNLGPIIVGNRKTVFALSKPVEFLKLLLGKTKFGDYFLSVFPGPRIVFCPLKERKEPFKPTPVESLFAELYGAAFKDPNQQFYFIPIFIVWRKYIRGERRKLHELLLGLSSNPNWIGKLWYLLRKRQDSTVRGLAPISLIEKNRQAAPELTDAIDENDNLKNARVLRRKIIVSIQQEMRVVLGPRYSPPTAVKETLMRDEEVQQTIRVVAEKNATDAKKEMMIAYRYLTEIVADYTYRFVEVMDVLLTWLFNKVFEGLVTNRDDIARVRDLMRTKPIVFVSCHRSHLDYLVVPYVMFNEDMVTPHIAAGINLSFWPVGFFLRKGGAFFIRRSFRGNDLYSIILKKYIEFLLKNRNNVKFFIEGTRSRSGKMLPPAFGLLKMIFDSYRSRSLDDIALVPVSISYDEVFEEGSYSKELQGAAKEKESTKGLIKSRKIIKRNIGKVYVRFAEPMFVKEIVQNSDQQQIEPKLTLQKTAFQLCKKINDVSVITPKSIVCSVLLGHQEPALPLSEILRVSDRMADFVVHSGMSLSANQKSGFRAAVESTLKTLQKKGFVDVIEATPRSYAVEQKRRVVLNFYKNNAIHCFILPSICLISFFHTIHIFSKTASSTINFYESFIQTSLKLRNILKFEFFFSPRQIFIDELNQTVVFFAKDFSPKDASSDEWRVKFGEYFKDWGEATVYMGLVGELLESYSTIMKFLKANPGVVLDKKQLIARLVNYSSELNEEGQIQFPESISVQNFSNGILSCENKGYLQLEKSEDLMAYRVAPWDHETEKMMSDIDGFLDLLNKSPSKLVKSLYKSV